MTVTVAAVAGALGAVARYAFSGWIQQRSDTGFPIGTFVVNITGVLGLGFVLGFGTPDSTLTLGGIGFLGGFTTFSTWMVESIGLGIRSRQAALNLVAGCVCGVLAFAVGYTLAT